MRPATRTAILVSIIGLIFLAGCLQRLGSGSTQFTSDYRNSLSPVALYDPNQSEECKVGSCWCMVCVNETEDGLPVTDLLPFWSNLDGGYCYFNKNCTAQTFANIMGDNASPNDGIRHFMVGQGPSFGSFATANRYCSDRLGMAVQWLLGSNVSLYTKPDAARTMCYLQKDVIPVYILYSNGTNISLDRSREIGRILGNDRDDSLKYVTSGPVGPVVVVTEMNFNASQASQVAQQVRAIDQECNHHRAENQINCFIAVAPKFNDFAALDAVMRELGGDANRVDLVAYGVDSRYANTCDGARILEQAINFSQYSLYNWSKPTIIPYIMFDSVGQDATHTCNWTEPLMISAYGNFFPNVNILQKKGVIGMAPYSWNVTGGYGITNPLNCTDCGIAKTDARLRSWYSGCQYFTNVSSRGEAVAGPSLGIYFGNESGTICNANADYHSILLGTAYAGRDIMQPQVNELRPRADLVFKCDACLLQNSSRPPNQIFPSLRNTIISDSVSCEAFTDEVDSWSSTRNLDPMLVRAFIKTESGFNPCSAAVVCSQACISSNCAGSLGCFPADLSGNSECYSKAYDEMYDPAGTCNVNLTPSHEPVFISGQIGFRYCALGLMQSLEPPYTFWPANYNPTGQNGPYFDVVQNSGFYTAYFSGNPSNDTRVPALDMARACNPYFNPFNPGDSICIGTAKIEGMLAAARGWINTHRGLLNWGANDVDKDSLFAAYIAADMYSGFWGSSSRSPSHPHPCSSTTSNGDCWALHFSQSWAVNDTYCQSSDGQADTERCQNGHPHKDPPQYCYGYTDFLEFVRDCEAPFNSRPVDPGRGKIEAYLGLLNGCANNFCPEDRRISQILNISLPASGTFQVGPNGSYGNSTPRPGNGT
ncbi:MAG TPA: hypothetical protein VLD37_01365 [Candidatus Bilamarchaeum sp.]|nr:hypothetical protein [Candidatus Bilamarchaeum sp.]